MSARGRILVVDDEVNARLALSEVLRVEGYDVEMAADAFKALGKYLAFDPDVVLTDLRMPGMDGIELVKRIRRHDHPAEVIVMTAYGAVSTALEAVRAGASEYVVKPLNLDDLLSLVSKSLANRAPRERTVDEPVRDSVGSIVGTSSSLRRVFDTVEQVAPSRATVLITGESGTGKELIAGEIHRRSPRAQGPFVKLHCAALAESLLESELFGHEKGAFTGAATRKDGRFTLADGGTLFLDEIGEISPMVQIKLLRFLQEYEFERVGGTQTLKVDVRVIAATNRSLPERIAAGLFREDLYYRLNVIALEMPSLRERKSDIPELANHFVGVYAKQNAKLIEGISDATMEVLVAYDWPGNVRELQNAIERAVVLAPGPMIESRFLPGHISPSLPTKTPPMIPGATLAEIERYAILETLKSTGGSKARAAEILGICTRTIHYRLHHYNHAPRSGISALEQFDALGPAIVEEDS